MKEPERYYTKVKLSRAPFWLVRPLQRFFLINWWLEGFGWIEAKGGYEIQLVWQRRKRYCVAYDYDLKVKKFFMYNRAGVVDHLWMAILLVRSLLQRRNYEQTSSQVEEAK